MSDSEVAPTIQTAVAFLTAWVAEDMDTMEAIVCGTEVDNGQLLMAVTSAALTLLGDALSRLDPPVPMDLVLAELGRRAAHV